MNAIVSCRVSEKSDLPEILRLYAQPGIDDGNTLSRAEAENIFEKIGNYPNYRINIATSNDKVVGTFVLLIMDNIGHLGAPSAVIEDVAVDPAHQGQGIGKAMMKHALDTANEHGCYKAVLSSNLRRDLAHRFYESLGFERHGYSYRVDLVRGSAADKSACCCKA